MWFNMPQNHRSCKRLQTSVEVAVAIRSSDIQTVSVAAYGKYGGERIQRSSPQYLSRTEDSRNVSGAIIWCGGFTKSTAQVAQDTGLVDLIALARPFVANPDLVARFQSNWPLAEADRSALYTRDGEKGYTDYSNSFLTILFDSTLLVRGNLPNL
jgi:2,4-dienoyl-CoA reductase-like NADH-dependent reductase (Old Yellow Enzyme family)